MRDGREDQRPQIKAILVGDGTETGTTINRYDFLEKILFEILEVQAEHLSNLIMCQN